MTSKTMMTRTTRLAMGTVAVLALMSQAAQARPTGVPVRTHIVASSSILKNKLQVPATVVGSGAISPAAKVARARGGARLTAPPARGQVTQLTRPTRTVTGKTSIDWLAAAIGIGLGAALGLIMLGATTLIKHGRRRYPLSA